MSALSLLLYGPSGCGKSFLAEAIFGEINDPKGYVELKTKELLKDPSIVEKLFANLKRFEVNCVLIENIDILFKDLLHSPAARHSLISKLKDNSSEMIIIGTSKYPRYLQSDEIESFTYVIPLTFPPYEDRLELLKSAGKWNDDQEDTLVSIAKKTEWWTSEEICTLANYIWTNRDDLSKIIDATLQNIQSNINVTKRKMTAAEILEFTVKFCTNTEIREAVKLEYGTSIASSLDNAVTLKPGIFGCDIDLKQVAKCFWDKFRKRG